MRAIWKGVLSFGLVNIPINMYTASKEKEVSFVLLHKKDLSQVRYARICKTEDKEIPWNEIVKGYEYRKGDYVVLTEEDFQKANLKKSKMIEIVSFVEIDEVDTVYYSKPYFLEPDKNSAQAYSLLRDALKKSNKAGLAKYVLHNREHIALLKVHEDMLILNELRYQNEIVQPADLNIPAISKAKGKELEIAMQLIDQLTTPFIPKEYKDPYVEQIKQIIKMKSKGKPVQIQTEEPKSTKVEDIFSLLQASLEKKKKPQKKPRKTA